MACGTIRGCHWHKREYKKYVQQFMCTPDFEVLHTLNIQVKFDSGQNPNDVVVLIQVL